MAKKRTATRTTTRRKYSEADRGPVVQASTCTRCGSANRTAYNHTRVRDFPDLGYRIVYRYCRCGDCDQVRVDREQQPLVEP